MPSRGSPIVKAKPNGKFAAVPEVDANANAFRRNGQLHGGVRAA